MTKNKKTKKKTKKKKQQQKTEKRTVHTKMTVDSESLDLIWLSIH